MQVTCSDSTSEGEELNDSKGLKHCRSYNSFWKCQTLRLMKTSMMIVLVEMLMTSTILKLYTLLCMMKV